MKIAQLYLAIATVALAACSTPQTFTDKPMTAFDRDTDYAVEDTASGFVLTISYGRYQYLPEASSVAVGCRLAFANVAQGLAARKGRQIQPVDEQRINISLGRNGISGVTSCSATAPVTWKS